MTLQHAPARRDGPVLFGLRENWRQFALLVATNAFVGGMIGLERTILPLVAEAEFGLSSRMAAVSFIATFAVAKAVANLVAGHLSERWGRRAVLIAGWLLGAPVPLLLIWAPTWDWVVAANVLLGLNQGLAWSMTANMKLDLVGPRRRGLALGANEAAGYLAVAVAAFLTGIIAQSYGLRPEPFYLGIGFAGAGLALSALFIRDTTPFVRRGVPADPDGTGASSFRHSFLDTTWRDRYLFGITQAGFVKNLNDALAWGIFPLYFASHGLSFDRIAALAAAYPLVWGTLQLATGWASDVTGRRPVIVGGMLIQALAIALAGATTSFDWWMAAVVLLGVGTALVYPTLQAAVGDAVPEAERATSLGVFRFWRDLGTMAGALVAGLLADLLGFGGAIHAVAALTAASGLVVWRASRTVPTATVASERTAGDRERRRTPYTPPRGPGPGPAHSPGPPHPGGARLTKA